MKDYVSILELKEQAVQRNIDKENKKRSYKVGGFISKLHLTYPSFKRIRELYSEPNEVQHYCELVKDINKQIHPNLKLKYAIHTLGALTGIGIMSVLPISFAYFMHTENNEAAEISLLGTMLGFPLGFIAGILPQSIAQDLPSKKLSKKIYRHPGIISDLTNKFKELESCGEYLLEKTESKEEMEFPKKTAKKIYASMKMIKENLEYNLETSKNYKKILQEHYFQNKGVSLSLE